MQASMHLERRQALRLVAGTVALVVWPAARSAQKSIQHTVLMEATAYAPIALTVRSGDVIEWVNKDRFPHTVTSEGVFDSGSIAAGASWRLRPDKPGRYPYICVFHPNMKGTLIVT